MPRKRSELGANVDKRIAALMTRGWTAEAIAKELQAKGTDVSTRTIGRRMRELRGDVAAPRASSSPTRREHYAMPDPASPAPPASESKDDVDEALPGADEIPEEANLAQIERWLKRAEAMAQKAMALGDIAGMGQMGRLTSALLEAKRRATPPEKADPNDRPDMVAAAQRARDMLHRMIDQAIGRE